MGTKPSFPFVGRATRVIQLKFILLRDNHAFIAASTEPRGMSLALRRLKWVGGLFIPSSSELALQAVEGLHRRG